MTHRPPAMRKRWPPTKAEVARLIAEATVDAFGECESRTGFYTAIEEHLVVPFEVDVLGVVATVERIDLTPDDRIVAIVKRGRSRQAISVLDLPIPKPPPSGAEWIEAYRCWSRGL